MYLFFYDIANVIPNGISFLANCALAEMPAWPLCGWIWYMPITENLNLKDGISA
jgi:hypothetical protein